MKPLEQRTWLSRSPGQIKTAESSDEKLKAGALRNLTLSVTGALQSRVFSSISPFGALKDGWAASLIPGRIAGTQERWMKVQGAA